MSKIQLSQLLRYGTAVLTIILATLLRKLLDPELGARGPHSTYIAAIMFVAWYAGLGPSLLTLAVSAILMDYLFIDPRGSVFIYSLDKGVDVGLFLCVGAVVILLTESLHRSHDRISVAHAELAGVNRQMQKEVGERQKAEKWLLESERRFRGYFEQSLIGMAMLTADKYWIEANARLCRMLGYTEEDLMHKTWTELTHPDDLPVEEAQLQQMLAGSVKGYSLDKRFLCNNGATVYASLSAQRMTKDDGTLDCILVLIQDISERKQLEASLQAAKESSDHAKAVAELANRAKDYFLAVLSHELRTPLAPVVMGVSMLQDRRDLDQDVRETLEMVRRNAELEARLIDDLLDMTRIARGTVELRKQRVSLGMVIDYAIEVCRPDIEAKKLNFSVDTGPDSPYCVEADITRLEQVFWNLLKNAVKFTPHEGRVSICCRLDEQGNAIVEVKDSGIGIAPEALPRLFNAFEQANRSISRQFGGLGLGLAISKAMVELHGGGIEAHSEGLGKGATFRVRLPLVAPASPAEALAASTPQPPVDRRLRILLVEDHCVTAKITGLVLTADGHEVETAGDAAAALKLADQRHFDLLISDLGLPDSSGYDLIRELRSRGHKFPGIALSGYGQEEDIFRSHEAGFADHLTKPVPRERLVETIAKVMSLASE